MAEATEEPDYACDEKTKSGFVHLKIKIDNLKVKAAGIMQKLRSGRSHPEGKNAEICIPEYDTRGFELNIKGGTETEMKGAHYKLKIQQLPYEIAADECYIKAEDGWVHLFLKKADVNQSWEKYIREGNLETAG